MFRFLHKYSFPRSAQQQQQQAAAGRAALEKLGFSLEDDPDVEAVVKSCQGGEIKRSYSQAFDKQHAGSGEFVPKKMLVKEHCELEQAAPKPKPVPAPTPAPANAPSTANAAAANPVAEKVAPSIKRKALLQLFDQLEDQLEWCLGGKTSHVEILDASTRVLVSLFQIQIPNNWKEKAGQLPDKISMTDVMSEIHPDISKKEKAKFLKAKRESLRRRKLALHFDKLAYIVKMIYYPASSMTLDSTSEKSRCFILQLALKALPLIQPMCVAPQPVAQRSVIPQAACTPNLSTKMAAMNVPSLNYVLHF
jgi:hypothetical protein